jgi:hypothetical protein
MDKRKFRGIVVFGFVSILVVIIGIIMKVFDQFTTGKAGGRNPENIVLSGRDVIILGILMLLCSLYLYEEIKRGKTK